MRYLLVLCFITILLVNIVIETIVLAQSHNATDTSKAVFYGSKRSLLKVFLGDIPTAMNRSTDVFLYLEGGIPRTLFYRSSDKIITLGINLMINNSSPGITEPDLFIIEFGGFYVKTNYIYTDYELKIYATPLYNTQLFYFSICSAGSKENYTIDLDITSNMYYDLLYIERNKISASINGIRFGVYVLSMQVNVGSRNESVINIATTTSINQCLNFLLGFNDSIDVVAEDVVRYIDYTKKTFDEITARIPSISVSNDIIKNLYLLSIYNTLNIISSNSLGDGIINLYPEESLSLIYLSRLSKINLDINVFVERFRRDPSFYLSVSGYLYFDPGVLRILSRDLVKELLKTLDDLINATERSSELAKIYWSLRALHNAAMYVGDGYVALIAGDLLSKVRNKLNSFYTGYSYALSRGEDTISLENALEAATLSLYDVPNSDKHIIYVANSIASLDTSKILVERKFAIDAIEALTRTGYVDIALKLVSTYYDAVLYRGVLCIDFYRVLLRGFLGIQLTLNSILISPHIPLPLMNSSVIIFLCGRDVSLRYIYWGDKVNSIYLDNLYYPETVISCDTLRKYSSIIVILEKKYLTLVGIRVFVGNAPARDSYVELFTSGGYTTASYTDNSGRVLLVIPCEEKWVAIKINNSLALINTSSWDCRESEVSIYLSPTYLYREQESIENISVYISELLNKFNDDKNKTVGELSMRIETLEKNLISLERNISDLKIRVDSIAERQSFSDHLIYIGISIAVASLALAIIRVARGI